MSENTTADPALVKDVDASVYMWQESLYDVILLWNSCLIIEWEVFDFWYRVRDRSKNGSGMIHVGLLLVDLKTSGNCISNKFKSVLSLL